LRDIKEKKYKSTFVKLKLSQIEAVIGVPLSEAEISNCLHALGFKTVWRGKKCTVRIPSWRRADITIPEDVIEEVVRIYGYHNLPKVGLTARLPLVPTEPEIGFESKVREAIIKTGGCEVITLSLVPQEWVENGVKITNPLGSDGAYMRTSIVPALINAANQNRHEKETLHIFEIGHIFKRRNNNLPDEITHLAGVFMNSSYRLAKGVIDSMLSQIGSNADVNLQQKGQYFVYEVSLPELMSKVVAQREFKAIPKYPAQVEDMTFVLPKKVTYEQVVRVINKVSELIVNIDLVDIYKDTYTLRISYQDTERTLTDADITPLRKQIETTVKKELKGEVK
jgi:phenylalanyl-tRNA synthetase beta chain